MGSHTVELGRGTAPAIGCTTIAAGFSSRAGCGRIKRGGRRTSDDTKNLRTPPSCEEDGRSGAAPRRPPACAPGVFSESGRRTIRLERWPPTQAGGIASRPPEEVPCTDEPGTPRSAMASTTRNAPVGRRSPSAAERSSRCARGARPRSDGCSRAPRRRDHRLPDASPSTGRTGTERAARSTTTEVPGPIRPRFGRVGAIPRPRRHCRGLQEQRDVA